MLVRTTSFSSKSMPRGVVSAPFQGPSNFDHLKKAAENIMRQQHSDKTDMELAAQRIRTLEQEKAELVDVNSRLLEAKVKLETIAQAGKKSYNSLRADCLSNSALCAAAQEIATDAQKKSSTINSEIAFLKNHMQELKRLCDVHEGILSKQVVSSRDLKSKMNAVTSERDIAIRQLEEHQHQLKSVSESLRTGNTEIERLNKLVGEQAGKIQALVKESSDKSRQLTIAQEEITQQGKENEKAIQQILEEKQNKLRIMEESERNLRSELEQLRHEIQTSKDSVEGYITTLSSNNERIKELESEISQHTQSSELFRSDTIKFEQERESLNKELAELRGELAKVLVAKDGVVEELKTAKADLADAMSSLEAARKQSEVATQEQSNSLTTAFQERSNNLTAAFQERETELKAAIETAQQRLVEAQAEKDAALRAQQASFNAMKETWVAEALHTEKVLGDQLSDALAKANTLAKDKEDLIDDNATLTAKTEEYRRDLEQAKKQAKDTNAKSTKSDKKEIENLMNLVEEQTKEITNLKRQLKKPPPAKPVPSSTSTSASSSSSALPASKFLIQAKDVPTTDKEARDTTEGTDSAVDAPSSSQKEASSSEQKKKRLLRTTPESSSPRKKVHFFVEQAKKTTATYSRRKATKPKTQSDDEYTFPG